jgi:folate-binding protein YgfZ
LKCQFSTLDQDALLHIDGPDSLKFLQGQTSCDTRNVDPDHALPGVFCTPQGRVICDFLLCELAPEHFALRLRRDIRTVSSTAFGKYIIFSKAKLEDSREDWKAVGIWGPDAAQALEELFGEVPAEPFGACSREGFVLLQTDTQSQQFECYLHDVGAQDYLNRMAEIMQPGSESDWQAMQIISGTARIESATVEEFVPQTLNYDLTGHISFDKGCYTGQEVIARLHYRGTPKRRTYVVELPPETTCTAGTPVFDASSQRNAGSIVNCALHEGKIHALVAATTDGLSNGLLLGSATGSPLAPGLMPYELDSPEA